jgi:MFS family permease
LLLVAFGIVEMRVADPMFKLDLFRNRAFAMNNAAGFLASVGRGGLQFMIIIWLQGVGLPLHGYSFARTPLWAGIYMIPLTVGFLIVAPIGGWLSDRHGARELAAAGMVITALGFVGLTVISADFSYAVFAGLLLVLGIGMGLFTAPNTTAIMNAVPAAYRGVASGMRATFQNVASTLSITVIFSLVTVGLAKNLPGSLMSGLSGAGIPADAAAKVAGLPPVGALFAAFLGYNPLATLIPASVLDGVSAATRTTVLGTDFFPTLLSGPFKDGVALAFLISAALSVVAALASLAGGRRYVHESSTVRARAVVEPKGGVS